MSTATTTAATVLMTCVSVASAGEPKRIAEIPELDGLTERWETMLETFKVPGMSIGIVKDGEIVALDAIGVRNTDGAPVDADTMFYIASCTKTYTAAGLAALAADGRVNLDAPVRSYLPRFKLADAEATESITVRDLLCHRPGVNSSPIVFLDAYTGQVTEDRYYKWLETVEPTGEVQYSNVHFTLAGRVIEAVSDQPWQDYLDQRIFDAHGMTRTTAYASEMYGDANAAIPMQWNGEAFEACPTRKTDRTMHAAGGMGTTARDGARWIQLQLGDDSMRSLRVRQSTTEPRGRIRRLDGFGLGWMLGTYRGRPYAQHGGGYIGTAAHLSFLTEEGIGVVVLCNADAGGQGATAIASIDIYDRFLGETGHDDLLPGYTAQIDRFLASRPSAVGGDDLVAAGGLTLPPASYAGRYENDDWGTLRVHLEAGELAAAIGDLSLRLVSTGPNTFRAETGAGDGYDAAFVVESEQVVAVTCESDGLRIRFER